MTKCQVCNDILWPKFNSVGGKTQMMMSYTIMLDISQHYGLLRDNHSHYGLSHFWWSVKAIHLLLQSLIFIIVNFLINAFVHFSNSNDLTNYISNNYWINSQLDPCQTFPFFFLHDFLATEEVQLLYTQKVTVFANTLALRKVPFSHLTIPKKASKSDHFNNVSIIFFYW